MTRYNTTRYDYRLACEDNKIDVKPYKKESIGNYRFTVIAEKKK